MTIAYCWKTVEYENWKRVNTRSRRFWRAVLVRKYGMGDSNEIFLFVGMGTKTPNQVHPHMVNLI